MSNRGRPPEGETSHMDFSHWACVHKRRERWPVNGGNGTWGKAKISSYQVHSLKEAAGVAIDQRQAASLILPEYAFDYRGDVECDIGRSL